MAQEAQTPLTPQKSNWADWMLLGILSFAIVVGVAATAYLITIPKEGDHFTEFYLLGAQGKSANYPRDIQLGESYPLIIGIGNQEYRNVTYTVEIDLVNMSFDPVTNTSIVLAMTNLDRFQIVLPPGITREIPWNLTITQVGYNRVQFLLFDESVPDYSVQSMDRINASYRDLHLWVAIHSEMD